MNSEVNRYIRGDLESPECSSLYPHRVGTHPPGIWIRSPTQKLSELCCLGVFMEVSFGEGNGTTLQYSCLENPTDGGAW